MKHFSLVKLLFIGVFASLLLACNNEPTAPKPVAGTADFAGFEMMAISGVATQKAVKKNADGKLTEMGMVANGQKHGQWVTYNVDNGLPKSITNFVEGLKSGVMIEFNKRGQIEKMTNYTNDMKDGMYAQYKFGRTVETLNYTNGKKDGIYTKYFNNKDIIQQEVTYKKDSLDGSFRYYNETGDVVLEYEYDNGKKISGGEVKQ